MAALTVAELLASGANCAAIACRGDHTTDREHDFCYKCSCAVAKPALAAHSIVCDGKGVRQAPWDGLDTTIPNALELKNRDATRADCAFRLAHEHARTLPHALGQQPGGGMTATVQQVVQCTMAAQNALTMSEVDNQKLKSAIAQLCGQENSPKILVAVRMVLRKKLDAKATVQPTVIAKVEEMFDLWRIDERQLYLKAVDLLPDNVGNELAVQVPAEEPFDRLQGRQMLYRLSKMMAHAFAAGMQEYNGKASVATEELYMREHFPHNESATSLAATVSGSFSGPPTTPASPAKFGNDTLDEENARLKAKLAGLNEHKGKRCMKCGKKGHIKAICTNPPKAGKSFADRTARSALEKKYLAKIRSGELKE